MALAEVLSRPRAWDDLGDWCSFRLQGEPEDRFSGPRRSPQQRTEKLAPGTKAQQSKSGAVPEGAEPLFLMESLQ